MTLAGLRKGGTTFGTIKGAVEAGAGMVVDTAKALIEQRISQDHEALQQNLEKLEQWTAMAALLGQQKVQGALIDTAKQAWEIAPPPEQAGMVAGLVTNVLAGMATGGAGLGARVATLMNVGALGSLVPTTEGGSDGAASLQDPMLQEVALRGRPGKILQGLGLTADDAFSGLFAVGRELKNTQNFVRTVGQALSHGIPEREIADLAKTNVMRAVANTSNAERVGVLGAILHAKNQGFELVDVVLQNASGHGVVLLFKTPKGYTDAYGKTLTHAVVEAKGGANSLGALDKVNGNMRQGGLDYVGDRLEQATNWAALTPQAKTAAAEALAAYGNKELGSFAFLGGRDLFYQLNFTGPSSSAIKAMDAVKIDWKIPSPAQWPSSGFKT